MSTTPPTVLIFGAAGSVGSAAALAASSHGAKTYLAMRDTTKPIPALFKTPTTFSRVQADLTDPDSIKQAVKTSGAQSAFVYAVLPAQDSMASAFAALKDAGITTIVLLSSYSVQPSAEEAQHSDFVPAAHAKIELALMASGVKYVAVRPSFFASNIAWYTEGIKKGEVSIFEPKARFDFITPEDIGGVIGHLLTHPESRGPENEKNGKSVFLCGPQLMDREEAVAIVGKVLGKEIKTSENCEEGFKEEMKNLPPPLLESLLRVNKENVPPKNGYDGGRWERGSGNVTEILGREPMKFTEWVEANKGMFA